MERDNEIFDLIEHERERQINGLELIASENYASEQVMEAQGSVLTNKYAEGLPYKRYYGGCEVVDQIETLAINRAKELFDAEWVNVQPHSGAQANTAVFLACLNPGDTILGFDLSHGGHLTHGSPVNISGKYFNARFYGVEQDTGLIDFDKVAEQIQEIKPKMVIAGASAYSRDWEYKKLRDAADSVNAILLADISHPSGLIARGLLNDPLKYCHIVTTTTHKTLRGPRGGMIMMGKNFENPWGITTSKGKVRKMSGLLDSAVFPGTQGGPLEHVISAKAVAYQEANSDDYFNYIQKVRKNAKVLSQEFINRGYEIISGGTDNHLMLIDLRPKKLTGKVAEDALIKADITINKNMVPFDNESPLVTSGIRVGTSAVTTRGLDENDMVKIADLIDKVLMNHDDEGTIQEVKKEVNDWMKDYPLFKH